MAHNFTEYANGTILLDYRCCTIKSQCWKSQCSKAQIEFLRHRFAASLCLEFIPLGRVHFIDRLLRKLSIGVVAYRFFCFGHPYLPLKTSLNTVFFIFVSPVFQPVVELHSVVTTLHVATIRCYISHLPALFFTPVQNLLRT